MQREGMYIFSSRVHTHDLQLMGISNEADRVPETQECWMSFLEYDVLRETCINQIEWHQDLN